MRCSLPRLVSGLIPLALAGAVHDPGAAQAPAGNCNRQEIVAAFARLRMPDLTGCPVDAITTGLAERQLAFAIERRSSDGVPEGVVMAQSYEPGAPLDNFADMVLVLTVSSGPERRLLPVAVADARAVEGEPLEFAASIERPEGSDETYRYRYTLRPGTAREGVDYDGAAGELIFGPGESRRTISVPTRPNGEAQPDRTLALVVAAGDRIVGRAVGTIADPPPAPPPPAPPPVTVGSTAVAEGEVLRFVVRIDRDETPGAQYAFDYRLEPASPGDGLDGAAAQGTLLFAPGQTVRAIDLRTRATAEAEGDRRVALVLLADGREVARGVGTILDRLNIGALPTDTGATDKARGGPAAPGPPPAGSFPFWYLAIPVVLLAAALLVRRLIRRPRPSPGRALIPAVECDLDRGPAAVMAGANEETEAPVVSVGVAVERGEAEVLAEAEGIEGESQ